jgi:2-C-methyl-D-erythritol 4-phosphate cytidylyltransferase/2-C-methyl-D-erythritol 2,4-cyclodiphosphate synthase
LRGENKIADLRVSVIIPAAGLGKRIKGSPVRKPFIHLGARPVLMHIVDVFKGISAVKEIILVVNKKDLRLAGKYFVGSVAKIIPGGPTRAHSVANGIKAVRPNTDIVLIHDGARPFVNRDIIKRSIAAAARFGAAIAAVPVIPTIKRADEKGFVVTSLNRRLLWEVQTPQAFRRDLIIKAFAASRKKGDNITDEAMLVEKMGGKVKLVMGSYDNIKITTPKDLAVAKAMTAQGVRPVRVGFGYDIHRLVRGRRLVLGGVRVASQKGLLGHSDADALLHAVIDALLGAAGLGDIGGHFPDTDRRYKGIPSSILLEETAGLVKQKGYSIGNIDSVIIMQGPKLGALKLKMAKNIAAILDIPKDRVNVKAKTNEGLDSIGRGRAIAAYAVATLQKK